MDSGVLEYQIIELEHQLAELYECRNKYKGKHRNPSASARWYNIDMGEHYITSQGFRFYSTIFWVESRYCDVFYEYYRTHFGIDHTDENELLRRLKLINIDSYTLIDPYDKEVSIPSTNIKKYKYRNVRFRIVSNNQKLFESLIDVMVIMSTYISRKYLDWFNTEIRQYLNFTPPIIQSDDIITTSLNGQEIYYSEHHRLWGFNRKEFDYIYTLEVGHSPCHQKLLLGRLSKRKRDMYANLDPSMHKMDRVCKSYTSNFNFVDDNLMIVANSKTIFEAYRKLLLLS